MYAHALWGGGAGGSYWSSRIRSSACMLSCVIEEIIRT